MPLAVGSRVPSLALHTHDGTEIRVGPDAERVVVLYFYPKDETAGCTAEACAFRDQYEDFAEAGATVVGVSADDDASHRRFAAHHGLPFHLVSDRDGSLRKAFDVPKTWGLVAGRMTFVINRSGVVRHAFSSQLRVRSHVEQALEIVKSLAS